MDDNGREFDFEEHDLVSEANFIAANNASIGAELEALVRLAKCKASIKSSLP
jgi:hypothetical protein